MAGRRRTPEEWVHIDRCDDLQAGHKVTWRRGGMEGTGTFVDRVARPNVAVRYRVRTTVRTPVFEKVRWKYRLLSYNQIVFQPKEA